MAGIELSADSIRFATHNAALNGLAHKVSFRAGDAAQIFATVGDFLPSRTALVIDPPRNGCHEAFVRQLLAFCPQTDVYVSCNVHTQARDVGQVVLWSAEEVALEMAGGKYVVEGLRGFDLFPQTAHVESVAEPHGVTHSQSPRFNTRCNDRPSIQFHITFLPNP